jgi:hypothetical protein
MQSNSPETIDTTQQRGPSMMGVKYTRQGELYSDRKLNILKGVFDRRKTEPSVTLKRAECVRNRDKQHYVTGGLKIW